MGEICKAAETAGDGWQYAHLMVQDRDDDDDDENIR